MEVETHMSFRTAEKISILVVDDDATFLPVVAGLLKKCNYQGTYTKSLVMSLSSSFFHFLFGVDSGMQ